MSKNRFAVIGKTRIELTDDDWIEVKSDLDTGEQKQLENCAVGAPVLIDGRLFNPVDWTRYEIERALIFITAWSFHDAKGVQQPVNLQTLKGLDTLTFDEVNEAIKQHIGELGAKKNIELLSRKKPVSAMTSSASNEN